MRIGQPLATCIHPLQVWTHRPVQRSEGKVLQKEVEGEAPDAGWGHAQALPCVVNSLPWSLLLAGESGACPA